MVASSLRRHARALAYSILAILIISSQAASGDSSSGDALGANEGALVSADHDRTLLDLMSSVPEFGGAYVDDSGSLRLWLTKPSQATANHSRDMLQAAFETSINSVEILHARYTFNELKSWHDQMVSLLGIEGVVFTDINDRANRLTVAVTNLEQGRAQVEAELGALGIPSDAVEVIEATSILPTLRQERRPLRGGLQIQFQTGALGLGTGMCTLGFIAVRAGISGFVTNSHCSRTRSEVDASRYWQPTRPILDGNQVGHETVDPPFFTGGSCPAGKRCRFSDANFVKTSVNLARGTIARVALNNFNWNGAALYRIVNETGTTLDTTMNKVGRTTGRTSGPVTHVCINGVEGDIVLLCQHIVRANVDFGDSGSPVFRITNSPDPNDVRLAGILHSLTDIGGVRHFVYSGIGSVQTELGSLTKCAPGFAC